MSRAVCAALPVLCLITTALLPGLSPATEPAAPHSPNVGHPTFVSPHAAPIALTSGHVFVVNTPADTVDVIDTETRDVFARVAVGIDPVSVAVRPDGAEVWVSNHVSDSVSVIDNKPDSETYLQVIATVQQFDPETRATRFDEPLGIAFASNEKAYVALSSENEIAVVDVRSRAVIRRLQIPAQDPRAILVRGDRLYVIPFESNNQTQLSGGTGKIDGDLVTFNAWEHSIANNNVLSLGHVVDIVRHPRVPDRDLFVFDTGSDELVAVVDTLGTLLYGMAVDSKGRVFIAQTDARNEINGRSGTKKHGLAEMENRAFLNRITRLDFEGDVAGKPQFLELEPLPPAHPEPGEALATPFAIQVSDDDSTLVASAAASDQVFTVDVETGAVLGRVEVGAVPRGIALACSESGKPASAWVLNAVADTVSLVDLSDLSRPALVETIALEDPTHAVVKRGRIAFNSAAASTTETFACASCHPDGHTDQLLWVLKTPIVTGGDQIMPRSTMPIRGLRDTAPYHWDGIPGDPYGGRNSANIHSSVPPNSRLDEPTSTTRHLIDGGLAATMARVGDATLNEEGKPGKLSAAERDDMALFLLSVPYPPAQKRSYTNVLSKRATEGFRLFHIDGDFDGKPRPNVCGNCHRMPFWVSTNTPGTGMDAPTWRGAYDRFLILPQGRLNIIDFDFYRRVAERGIPERDVWRFSWGSRRRFDPIWDMVLEGSTGYSGALGRQVTLDKTFEGDGSARDLIEALEVADRDGGIVLEGEGTLIGGTRPERLALRFDAQRGEKGAYVEKGRRGRVFTRRQLTALAAKGEFVGTFTGRHGPRADVESPQPALWTLGPIEKQRGRQDFPVLFEEQRVLRISGRHIEDGAIVLVDGRRVEGSVREEGGEVLHVELAALPAEGLHLLQLQNPGGLFSNDFIFHVTKDALAARELRASIDRAHRDTRVEMARAIARGDIGRVRELFETGASRHDRNPESGSRPLSDAALHGRRDIAELLLRRGTRVTETNRDGNTALHVAAFLCREDIVRLLLAVRAPVDKKNDRGETPLDVVSGEWNEGLEGFYRGLSDTFGLGLDIERIRRDRLKMARLLGAKRQRI